MRRRWRIAIAAVLAALVPAAAALGDADPASDVLVAASVFYPYSTPVSSQLQKALSAEVAAASRAHLPLKVALITAPFDLGGLPALFGKPQQYARFLDQELTFNGKPPLLVVMPAGYGVAGMSAAGAQAATSLAQPAGKTSDDLARAAITAVPRLAAASGHPIASGSTPGGSSSGGGTGVAIGIVAAVAVATAAAIIALRRRRTRPR